MKREYYLANTVGLAESLLLWTWAAAVFMLWTNTCCASSLFLTA